ncbi:MAG: hypothetical protein Q8S33_19895 [Myxococcales bacterium]|nr:hypothetical protein [Myxococcales bacterium]
MQPRLLQPEARVREHLQVVRGQDVEGQLPRDVFEHVEQRRRRVFDGGAVEPVTSKERFHHQEVPLRRGVHVAPGGHRGEEVEVGGQRRDQPRQRLVSLLEAQAHLLDEVGRRRAIEQRALHLLARKRHHVFSAHWRGGRCREVDGVADAPAEVRPQPLQLLEERPLRRHQFGPAHHVAHLRELSLEQRAHRAKHQGRLGLGTLVAALGGIHTRARHGFGELRVDDAAQPADGGDGVGDSWSHLLPQREVGAPLFGRLRFEAHQVDGLELVDAPGRSDADPPHAPCQLAVDDGGEHLLQTFREHRVTHRRQPVARRSP